MKKLVPTLCILFALPLLLGWFARDFVLGLNPILSTAFPIVLGLFVIVLFIWSFRVVWLSSIGGKGIPTAGLFGLGAAMLALPMLLFPLFIANNALDIHLHDTYFVALPSLPRSNATQAVHDVLQMTTSAGWFAMTALLYFFFRPTTGRSLSRPLGQLHFWITFGVAQCYRIPRWYTTLEMPHGSGWHTTIYPISGINVVEAMLSLAAQGVLVLNIVRALRAPRAAGVPRQRWFPSSPDVVFAAGAFVLTIFGLLTGLMLGNRTLDIHLHDTYYVLSRTDLIVAVAAFLGLVAGIYSLFQRITGRAYNKPLWQIHFWVTFAGAVLLFYPVHNEYEGLAGMPRRYALAVFLAQLLLPINLVYALIWGKKIRPSAPPDPHRPEAPTLHKPGT